MALERTIVISLIVYNLGKVFFASINNEYRIRAYQKTNVSIFIGKAAAFVFFVFAEGCKYQRAYIFIPKIAQRILIVLVWNITIHS